MIACKRLKIGSKNKVWEPNRSDVICSDHFKAEDYSTAGRRRRLLPTAIPSVFKFRKESPVPSSRRIRYITNYGQVPVIASTSTATIDDAVMERLREVRRDLKNSKRREKRLKETVVTLRTLLVEELSVKESLLAKLESYKGVYFYLPLPWVDFFANLNLFFKNAYCIRLHTYTYTVYLHSGQLIINGVQRKRQVKCVNKIYLQMCK